MHTSEAITDALAISVNNTRLRPENYMVEKYDPAALNHLKKEILNYIKQHFFNEKNKVNLELVKRLKEQIDILRSEIYFLREEMKEKNNILKMFFHSPKPSPLKMTLSFCNSKDIIKDHHINLTSHPLVENPSSFAGSSIRSEKDNSIVFQEIKAKPGARQINNFTNNLTEQNRYQQQRQIGAQRKQNFERTTTAKTTTTTTK